jgi:uncharacterized protein YbbC (DUF1343 family)
MIATISPDVEHAEESISTCQFAKRVALVKNTAMINEELEPALAIKRLKNEVCDLREQLKYLKGENGEEGEITDEQKENLARAINIYLEDPDKRAKLNMGKITLSKLDCVFPIFKDIVPKEIQTRSESKDTIKLESRVLLLQQELKKRDKEIVMLVQMVSPSALRKCYALKNTQNSIANIYHSRSSRIGGVELSFDKMVITDQEVAFEWFKGQSHHGKSIAEQKLIIRNAVCMKCTIFLCVCMVRKGMLLLLTNHLFTPLVIL